MQKINGTRFVVANWKMNLGPSAAKDLAFKIVQSASQFKQVETWIAPPFVSITSVVEMANVSTVKVGAQNAHWEDSGAFTGEISLIMLKEIGAMFVIIGHSERRHLFNETNEIIKKRLFASLNNDFKTILCIGETDNERSANKTEQVLKTHLSTALADVPKNLLSNLIVAYEPVWAIGTGKVADVSTISSTHQFIRSQLNELSGSLPIPILYGGSVTPDNFEDILSVSEVAGALVGGASLDIVKFAKLIEIAAS